MCYFDALLPNIFFHFHLPFLSVFVTKFVLQDVISKLKALGDLTVLCLAMLTQTWRAYSIDKKFSGL